MSTREGCIGRPCSERDLQHSSQVSEQLLNDAIVHADVSRSFEEYLEIVERFYADEVVLTSEVTASPVRGKDAVRSVLALFLIPLHIMAEIGGMRTAVHVRPIASDNLNETHAAWTVDLVGVSGKNLHAQMAHSAQMGTVARRLRTSLRRTANWRGTDP